MTWAEDPVFIRPDGTNDSITDAHSLSPEVLVEAKMPARKSRRTCGGARHG
jgi:hypothetical protein